MTAVDQDGNEVAQYRVALSAPSELPFVLRVGAGTFGRSVEIIVRPDWDLTDELVLAIAISAPWLHWYFQDPRGS